MIEKTEVEFKDFDLVSFKNKGNGVDLCYYNKRFPYDQVKNCIKGDANPDLQNSMDYLKEVLATKLGLLDGWAYAIELSTNESEKDVAIRGYSKSVDSVIIEGLDFKGQSGVESVEINGKWAHISGAKGVIRSKKINLCQDDLNFDSETFQYCESIKREVYEYKFNRKRAQLDLVVEINKIENKE